MAFVLGCFPAMFYEDTLLPILPASSSAAGQSVIAILATGRHINLKIQRNSLYQMGRIVVKSKVRFACSDADCDGRGHARKRTGPEPILISTGPDLRLIRRISGSMSAAAIG